MKIDGLNPKEIKMLEFIKEVNPELYSRFKASIELERKLESVVIPPEYLLENILKFDQEHEKLIQAAEQGNTPPLPLQPLIEMRTLEPLVFNNHTFRMSIQAGPHMRSEPRTPLLNISGLAHYNSFEVYMSSADMVSTEWELFRATDDNLFNYVPKKLVELKIVELAQKYRLQN